ncbi:hypothetical protein UCRPC4_g04759 [Phaeomoniella chlamydospora]|uniref:Uncharacterized protein n=1 Tax=Phaeomoniella chlamydospora TaxID=158046 RepID=A0A0G2E797_PHACM|nr:hypothetical protein UCRPC4_g04759 [Phaeomoniella chlamydospora]
MDPPSPFKVPMTGGALHPVSPDRINQQRLPHSPSLPTHLNESKHHRASSDVQSKVAFLNNLSKSSISSPQQMHGNSTTAALQRAILGREEAESALRELQGEMEQAQARERRISERLESLMEELQSTKERQAHERHVYEKEIKRSRKDAFRAGSALVKLQEDLKEARSENRNLKSTIQKEKFEKDKARQEAFERAYTLAGLTEEMQALKEELRSAQSSKESDCLHQQVDELHIGHLLTEQTQEPDKEILRPVEEVETSESSEAPRRRNRFERPLLSTALEAEVFTTFSAPLKGRRETFFKSTLDDPEDVALEDRFEDLKAELLWEKRCRLEAEDLVHFMNMECQFNCCACRRAEKEGKRFVHDVEYDNKLRAESAERKKQTEKEPLEDSRDDNAAYDEAEMEKHHNTDTEPDAVNENPEPAEPALHVEATSTEMPMTGEQRLHSAASSQAAAEQLPGVEEAFDQELFNITQPNELANASSSEAAQDLLDQDTAQGTEVQQKEVFQQADVHLHLSNSPAEDACFQTPEKPMTQNVLSHTMTFTTTVPLRDHEGAEPCAMTPGTPGTPGLNMPGTPISREAALAQIRARRDRARSMSMKRKDVGHVPGSARRGLVGGIRDISAPGGY